MKLPEREESPSPIGVDKKTRQLAYVIVTWSAAYNALVDRWRHFWQDEPRW